MAISKRAVRIAILVLGLLGSAVLSGMGPLSGHAGIAPNSQAMAIKCMCPGGGTGRG